MLVNDVGYLLAWVCACVSCVCVGMGVCVWVRERERERDVTGDSFPTQEMSNKAEIITQVKEREQQT